MFLDPQVLSEEDPALADEAARDGAVPAAANNGVSAAVAEANCGALAANGISPAAGLPIDGPIGAGRMRVAAATALAAAAVRAKLMADEEEREIQHLVKQVQPNFSDAAH